MTTKIYPVDTYYKNNGIVYELNNDAYTCTLNQTDIETNKNKFYIMQIIKNGSSYDHFIRYGRIGEPGKSSIDTYMTKEEAISAFEKQFKIKTGNNWSNKVSFIKKDGKYFLTETVYEVEKINIVEIKKEPSKLNERVQQLIKYISDVESMKKTLIELNIDLKKMPLGKLSKVQIDKAQDILKKINLTINNQNNSEELGILSSEYYTYIPYSCGRKKPPMIDSSDKVGEYTNLLDDLRQMDVAIKINQEAETSTNPIDSIYTSLNTKIEPIDKSSEIWKQIELYIKNTHAPTHHFTATLVDAFSVIRQGERENYNSYTKNIDNKQLLWHGSRMTNFCSILNKGLLLNPANIGVVITGKMFGYGVYFANAFSKSANYTAYQTSNNYACLLLCEVALGNASKRTHADYYITKESLKKEGFDSTWGMGTSAPVESTTIDGIKIPNGKLTKSDVNSILLYDEFITYDSNQFNIKYMVIVKIQ
jgi:predicted DNA-binding WGR domain protein